MNWKPHFDALVVTKHATGQSVQQIATALKQPPYKVIDAHARLGLEPKFAEPKPRVDLRKVIPRQHNPEKRPDNIGPLEGANPVREAEKVLHGRLTWRRGIEMLDGRPCTLDDKMREANRILHKGRFLQLGKKPEWLW